MTPAITVCIYEDGWEVSTHLQVGMKTFRYYTTTFSYIGALHRFLWDWKQDWKTTASEVFDYEGIEDLTEPVEHSEVQLALSALLPPREPIKRRF